MDFESPTVDDSLTAAEPSLELLLQLAPFLLGSLVRKAASIAASRGRDPLAIQILAALAQLHEPSIEWADEIVRENEDLLHGDIGIALPLDQATVTALAELSVHQRVELIGPVIDRIYWRFGPKGAAIAPPLPEPNGGHGFDGGIDAGDAMDADGDGGAVANGGGAHGNGGGAQGNGGGAQANGGGHPTRNARRPRIVSTGFSPSDNKRTKVARANPLDPKTDYLFWLQIGDPVRGAIDVAPEEVLPDEELLPGARIKVVLFSFKDGLILYPGSREGALELADDGRFYVAPMGASKEQRLFFRVATLAKSGLHRLRANLYFRNVLVQSHLVTAYVGRGPATGPALSTKVDFRIARMLSGAELAPIQQHVVSIQLNEGDDGTHQFRFFGEADGDKPSFAASASIGEGALSDLIGQARGELRSASWGTKVAYTTANPYRYRKPAPGQLQADLFALHSAGFRIYDALINDLAGANAEVDSLRKLMLRSGRVEIVSRGSPAELVPASVVYDYTNAIPDSAARTLCPKFAEDLAAKDKQLEDADCFKGDCPSREDFNVVCPSGFWGFRHAIGMPVTKDVAPPAPVISRFDPVPTLGLAEFPGFKMIDGHEADLRKDPAWNVTVAKTFDDTLGLLKSRPHLLYFYCHGGLQNGDTPYLLVGTDPKNHIESAVLRVLHKDGAAFTPPRSLVLINGCQTTALEPDQAINLVSGFMKTFGAMGVIGTEVTIFEELATAFAKELIHHLGQGSEVGESVRLTRLALLKQGNPLGLVYVPFVAAHSRFAKPN